MSSSCSQSSPTKQLRRTSAPCLLPPHKPRPHLPIRASCRPLLNQWWRFLFLSPHASGTPDDRSSGERAWRVKVRPFGHPHAQPDDQLPAEETSQ